MKSLLWKNIENPEIESEIEDKFVDELLNAAAEKLEVVINPEIISEEVHRMIDGYANQLKMQGFSPEAINQYLEKNDDSAIKKEAEERKIDVPKKPDKGNKLNFES